jgi:hypothetical protein
MQQNYFHQGNNEQHPDRNAANVEGQHYAGAPFSANHQQPYTYQQHIHQEFTPQHQEHSYDASIPQSFRPQNHQQQQHYYQQKQQQQQQQHQASTNEINWVPKGNDLYQLVGWFCMLDSANKGYAWEAQAISFLSGFNLSKETLRLIWGLVDSQNTGCIDQKQFYKIIRLVAISCSPMYAGTAPSMEIYNRTVEEIIPLPPMSNSIMIPPLSNFGYVSE